MPDFQIWVQQRAFVYSFQSTFLVGNEKGALILLISFSCPLLLHSWAHDPHKAVIRICYILYREPNILVIITYHIAAMSSLFLANQSGVSPHWDWVLCRPISFPHLILIFLTNILKIILLYVNGRFLLANGKFWSLYLCRNLRFLSILIVYETSSELFCAFLSSIFTCYYA